MDANDLFAILNALIQEKKVPTCAVHLSLLFSEPSLSRLPLAVVVVAVLQTAHTAVRVQQVVRALRQYCAGVC